MAENRGPQLAAVMAVLLGLAWISMILRGYVRLRMLRSFGLDDWLAVAALALFTGTGGFVFQSVKHGVGQHMADLPPNRVPTITRDFYILETFFFTSTAMIKLSVSALLLRIAVKKSQNYIIFSQVVITVIFTVVATFTAIFACKPIEYFWLQYVPLSKGEGHCVLDPTGLAITLYVYVGVAVMTDSTLAILPWYIIRGSSLTIRDKISIMAVLGMGMLAGISAVVRVPYIRHIQTSADVTFTTADLIIWGIMEPGLGLIAASMGTLRPLFRDFFSKNRLFGSSTPPGQSNWPSSRYEYVRDTANSHVLRNQGGRDKGGDSFAIRSYNSMENLDLSESPNNRAIRNGSTRGLVVNGGNSSGSGDDIASEEGGPAAEWETGIMKTTAFSVRTEGVDVESVI